MTSPRNAREALKECEICGKLSSRRACCRTHENQLWRQENPEAYEAARRVKPKQKQLPGMKSNILARVDPITKQYRSV